MIFLFSRTLWFREKNPTLKNNRFTYTGSCIFFWLLFFALKHSNSYSHNIWWNISVGLWLLRSFQIVSSWRGRMVASPSSKVAKSAFRNAREASLGVMFNLFPAWIWTLNDIFKFVLFIWPAHLPRKVDGNLYIFLCVFWKSYICNTWIYNAFQLRFCCIFIICNIL